MAKDPKDEQAELWDRHDKALAGVSRELHDARKTIERLRDRVRELEHQMVQTRDPEMPITIVVPTEKEH